MPLNRRGFTLVELLVVMGIILILVSIAIPATNTARNKAKDTEVKSGCNQIQSALEQYSIDHGGYPGIHWEHDSAGNYYAGQGIIGALPSVDGGSSPRKDFFVPTVDDPTDSTWRDPYLNDPGPAGGTIPNVSVFDCLMTEGYLDAYPANPFLKASGGGKSQMCNLFMFQPILGDTPPVLGRYDTLRWHRFTTILPGGDASQLNISTMRKGYAEYGRGHFHYIPLNPVNNTGYDYEGEWATGNLSGAELSDYYKKCRGYMLVGWGHSRLIDGDAKGISEKYWNSSLNGGAGAFDFDGNMQADNLELAITDGSFIELEMRDSNNDSSPFGGATLSGAPDIDSAFFGAVFFKVSGS